MKIVGGLGLARRTKRYFVPIDMFLPGSDSPLGLKQAGVHHDGLTRWTSVVAPEEQAPMLAVQAKSVETPCERTVMLAAGATACRSGRADARSSGLHPRRLPRSRADVGCFSRRAAVTTVGPARSPGDGGRAPPSTGDCCSPRWRPFSTPTRAASSCKRRVRAASPGGDRQQADRRRPLNEQPLLAAPVAYAQPIQGKRGVPMRFRPVLSAAKPKK